MTNATISGGADNDTITLDATVASSSASTVSGNDDNDTITSNNTAVVLDGGEGKDVIAAEGAAKHTIFGGGGDDTIDADTGNGCCS